MTDALLAKQMYQLSLDERKQALHDLHGIAEIPQEDPEMVARALGALEEDIKNISEKAAYETALAMSPDYVRDPKFRLKFLKADNFDHLALLMFCEEGTMRAEPYYATSLRIDISVT